MKKIVASVSLAALGASGLQTTLAQSMESQDNSKPWSISATVRGFYDDNPATWPNDAAVPKGYSRDTYGFEIRPEAALRWALEQTKLSLAMVYSLKYYDNKPINSTDHYDQSFTFNAGLDHAFSDINHLSVRDSFVIGQEPDLLRAGEAFSTVQRISGDNIRNYGSVDFDAKITPLLTGDLGYNNSYYDYSDSGVGSLSALLDRVENQVHLDTLWEMSRETHLIVGYQFRDVSYTGDEVIGITPTFSPIMSDARNSQAHYFYVGGEHQFQPELVGTLRAGGLYSDYYNDPAGGGDNWSPYVKGSLRYEFLPGSTAELGFGYDRTPTDVVGRPGEGIARDAQTATVYGSISHKITSRITGSLLGQYQNSKFEGGSVDGKTEDYYLIGVNAEYRITPHFSAHAGYNYDNLHSELSRGFDRNRVYIGLTAAY